MASGEAEDRLQDAGAAAETRQIEAALRRQASAFERLTVEQEQALFARRGTDGIARERLVEHNLDLVVDQAEGHRDRGLSFADLYQEGTVGLIDAVEAYDGHGGFRDFASLHIGLQMDSLLESEAEARKRDAQVVVDCRNLDIAQVQFRKQAGREATEEELAQVLGWELQRMRRAALALDLARERNDATIVNFLDESDQLEEFSEDEPDPRRKLRGHGPDD